MAAAAVVANSRNNNDPDSLQNDCGCYDLFEGIDFDAPHEVIDAAIETALEGLSDEEIDYLFEPVCTADGEIYESACIADCQEIMDYHLCTDEELEDYFFGDFDCEDLENLSFPTDIELPDGTIVTVNNEEELWEVLDQWYEENGEEEENHEDCFTFLFPIQIQYPGGDIISYDNEEALYTGIDDWFENNPESLDEPLPVYPISVQLKDSTILVINNEEEEIALWEECYGSIDEKLCFEIQYPVSLLYPDSSTLEVSNEEELEMAIDAFYEENPDTETDIDLLYPIDILLSDGTLQTINDADELDAAIDSCFEDYGKRSISLSGIVKYAKQRQMVGKVISRAGQ